MEVNLGTCALCDAPAKFQCGRCRSASYCNREHQRQDFAEHKLSCTNYRVESSQLLGQHLVASCLMLPGNLVLREEPILVGPMAMSDLVCLACYSPLKKENFYRCPDCLWPMCNKTCSYDDAHVFECEVLAKDTLGIGVPQGLGETPRYDIIMTLRGMLLKEINPKAWDCIMSMEGHAVTRKLENDPYHKAAVRYLTEVCQEGFNEDEVHQVRGAIMTNCLTVTSIHNTTIRGLYPTVRLFNHSCIPNIHITTAADGTIEARAAVKIDKNEPLCISYTGTMEPLWKRQQCLRENYKFQCACKRCSDPTELGTYFSSPRCPTCRVFMKPCCDASVVVWRCESCQLKYELVDVLQEVSEWLNRMDMNDVLEGKSIKQLSKEVDRLYSAFNSTHYVPLQFTNFLLRKIKEDSYESHKLKREIWESHLELYNILEPGHTRRRGMTMLQLAASTMNMVRTGVLQQQLYLPRAPELLREARNLLLDAEAIMQLEPKASSERRWLLTIRNVEREIDANMRCHETGEWIMTTQ